MQNTIYNKIKLINKFDNIKHISFCGIINNKLYISYVNVVNFFNKCVILIIIDINTNNIINYNVLDTCSVYTIIDNVIYYVNEMGTYKVTDNKNIIIDQGYGEINAFIFKNRNIVYKINSEFMTICNDDYINNNEDTRNNIYRNFYDNNISISWFNSTTFQCNRRLQEICYADFIKIINYIL